MRRPRLLLADEPTGNVNPSAGRRIMATLREVARDEGATVLLVTHSPEHAAFADRICFIRDGAIAAIREHGGRVDDVLPIHEQLVRLGI
jgi:ABC-type lipoprotein export system ATPase subunit